jgi:protein-S-isoprenylcysteine O-methyltransferase Ste14
MSSRPRAFAGSLVFLVVAPGVTAGLVPWLLSRWHRDPDWPVSLQVTGWLLVALGGAGVLATFAQFVWEGRGTPAPLAPTERLVVRGLYRHVRNPMYLAVATVIVGQGIALPSVSVLAWAAGFVVTVAAFVRAYEEPTLARTHGASYDAYRGAVPGWRPRLTPWRG